MNQDRMISRTVTPGFATLHVLTQVVGHPRTHIALTAYVSGRVKCLPGKPNTPHMVEVSVQGQSVEVEAESLTDTEFKGLPFEFRFTDKEKTAA